MIDQQKFDEVKNLIIAYEWDMFTETKNKGGTAWCQNEHEIFEIMRNSQWSTMSLEILKSYKDDIEEAKHNGRNLLAEKYGYMMKYTHPEEYEQIRGILAPVSDEKEETAEKIVDIFMVMDDAAREKYPNISSAGRESRVDIGGTSVRTYMLGELLTYSQNTLDLYLEYIIECRDEGRNLSEENLEYTVLRYGYPSLAEAERMRSENK